VKNKAVVVRVRTCINNNSVNTLNIGIRKDVFDAITIVIPEHYPIFQFREITLILWRINIIRSVGRTVVDKSQNHIAGSVKDEQVFYAVVVQVNGRKLRGIQTTGQRVFQFISKFPERNSLSLKNLWINAGKGKEKKEKKNCIFHKSEKLKPTFKMLNLAE